MKLILLCLFILPFSVKSQKISLDFYAGLANYQGDLLSKKLSLDNSKPAFGLGLSYNYSDKLSARLFGTVTSLQGSDATNIKTDFNYRNLGFNTSLTEIQANVQFNLLSPSDYIISPYLFAGIAVFHFDPWTKDISGNKYYLQPLGTEGQGLERYPEKKLYKLTQAAIPFGGGITTQITNQLQLGVEMNLRKLFTDYLDDVSGTYADSTYLANNRNLASSRLAFRGNELLNGQNYPTEGAQRGNPKSKDWYYTAVIRISYFLKGKDNNSKKYGCPSF